MKLYKILLCFFTFCLNFPIKKTIADDDPSPLLEILNILPAAHALLDALPHGNDKLNLLKAFQSKDKKCFGPSLHMHYKQHRYLRDYIFTIDREDLINYPELATWHKNLVINWAANRYLWDEPKINPPDAFIPQNIDISKLKKLTTFAVNYTDLTNITTRISDNTWLDVTLVKPFTEHNYYAFLENFSPIIRTSSFYANFDTTKTLLVFLRTLNKVIRAATLRTGETLDEKKPDSAMHPHYLETLCPKLHLFVREANAKKTKNPLNEHEEAELNRLQAKFQDHLYVVYMQDLTPTLQSTLALIGMSNRIEVLQDLFPKEEDEADDTEADDHELDSDFVGRLDAALNLSQFHADELQKAITMAAPYLEKIEKLHTRTVLIEGLMLIPEEYRETALDIAFNRNTRDSMGRSVKVTLDPKAISRNVMYFYCLHMLPSKHHAEGFKLLEKLNALIVIRTCLVAHNLVIRSTSRSQAHDLAKHFTQERDGAPIPRKDRLQKLKDLVTL